MIDLRKVSAALVIVLCLAIGVLSAQEPGQPKRSRPLSGSILPEWLSLGGSARVRPEDRVGRGFADDDDAGYVLTRVRLGVGIEPGRWARFFVEGQDSRAAGLASAGTTLSDSLDLYQGYAELGTRDSVVRLRVGRQEMQYGQQRLISVNPWRNTGRSFDAARLFIGTDSLGVDVFASAVVDKQQDGLDGRVDGERLYGGYGRIGSESTGLRIEPYLLVRTRSTTGGRGGHGQRVSIGTRLVRQVSRRLDVSGEAVHQRGDEGDESVSAWMTYGIVGYQLDRLPWRPRISGEYSFASGDTNPDDGRAQGFDTLYNTPHRFYGYADLIGGRNIQDAHVEVTLRPTTPFSLVVDVHRLWLATRKDGLYGPGLRAAVDTPDGGFETGDVGTELDVTLTYRLRPWLSIGGGWSRLFGGRLLRTHTAASDRSFTYGTVEARF